MAHPEREAHNALKGACESIPQKQRLTIVSLMLTVFVLTAFFVFGHACYRIGLGKAQKSVEIEHIMNLTSLPNLPFMNFKIFQTMTMQEWKAKINGFFQPKSQA